MRLEVDPARRSLPETGIYVRAVGPDGWLNTYDIVHLTPESLLEWLGEDPDRPIATVLVLLRHHPTTESGRGWMLRRRTAEGEV